YSSRSRIRHRVVARLGGEGNQTPWSESGGGGKFRADPPLKPGRHGRASAPISRRRDRPIAWTRRLANIFDWRFVRRDPAWPALDDGDPKREGRKALRAGETAHRYANRNRLLPARRHFVVRVTAIARAQVNQ